MHNHVHELLLSQDSCVLATSVNDIPHASLMAFAVSADGMQIFMATSADTRKYANILANPRVSLLIDNRNEHPGEIHHRALALTLHGTAEIMQNTSEQEQALKKLLNRIPGLGPFLRDSLTKFIRIRIDNSRVVRGPSQAEQ